MSPCSIPERQVTASQAPSPVLPSAAAVTSSSPSSMSNSASSLASARSAIEPNGATVSSKYTRRPSGSRPTPSVPTADGSGGGPM